MGDYRGIILKNLVNEGNKIINKCSDDDELIKEEITSIRDENYFEELDNIASVNIDDLDDKGYERLSNQKAKTKTDRQRQKKYSIKKRYQVDATPDLILKDDDGYYPQLRLHYFLLIGFENIPQKDQTSAKKMRENQSAFLPDFNKSQMSAKVSLMRSLNIPQILELETFTQAHPLLIDMADKAKNHIWDLGMFLGKMHPDMTPVQILRKILKLLGLKLDRLGREGTGERSYIYRICGLADGRDEILQRWYESDLAKNQDVKCIRLIQNTATNSNINNSILAAPINQDANHQTTQTDHTLQNCFVWDGQGQSWVGAVLKKSEILINGTYKALVTLWNGLDRYIWESSHISIC
jgi:hypothetical protein